MGKIKLFLNLSFILYSLVQSSAQAQILRTGHAIVTIENRAVGVMTLDQAIRIEADNVTFVALSDFGGEVFRVDFSKNGIVLRSNTGSADKNIGDNLKKILALPLKKNEFVDLLNHECPEDFLCSSGGNNCVNEMDYVRRGAPACAPVNKGQTHRSAPTGEEIWHSKKNKNIEIHYTEFVPTKSGNLFPKKLVIHYKKTKFILKWQQISW